MARYEGTSIRARLVRGTTPETDLYGAAVAADEEARAALEALPDLAPPEPAPEPVAAPPEPLGSRGGLGQPPGMPPEC